MALNFNINYEKTINDVQKLLVCCAFNWFFAK